MKITRIALVEPSIQNDGLTTTCVNKSEPIGLCYIGALLQKEGYEVRIFQQVSESNQDLINQLVKFNPQVVGFTAMTYNFANALSLAKECKKLLEKIYVVFGGIHATNNQNFLKSKDYVDFVVIGEGEITFLELINCLDKQCNYQLISGIAFYDRASQRVIRTSSRSRIENLDNLPLPLRDGLQIGESCYARVAISYPSKNQGQRRASILTARGCQSNCAFCNSPEAWKRKWIGRSAQNVVDEIEFLVNRYGINYLEIRDENFAFSKIHAANICREIIRRGLNGKLHWYAQCRVDCLMENGKVDQELLKLFKVAGMFEIELGIESGNQQILNNIFKGIKLSQIRQVVDACHEIGLSIHGLFILGLPGEDENTIKETLALIKELEFDRIRFSFSVPFEGTRLFTNLTKEDQGVVQSVPCDKLTTDYPILEITDKNGKIIYGLEELINIRKGLYREYYQSQDYRNFLFNKWGNEIDRLPQIIESIQDWFEITSII